MKGVSRAVVRAALALSLFAIAGNASAQTASNYTTGHISNVTFMGETVFIMVDAGLPGNCAGTSWGYMKVPVANKPMVAFVIGLWMRSDAAQTLVSVYTDGLADGYCRITQIDPAG